MVQFQVFVESSPPKTGLASQLETAALCSTVPSFSSRVSFGSTVCSCRLVYVTLYGH